jgi:AcrR family transcriptional regulator
MKSSPRLSSEARREAIVQAVKGVFAEKGFDGTTTRELAKAANVSEALLYKHFPSKESLYAAMLDACVKGAAFIEFRRILALEPSASTVVIMTHFVIERFVQARPGDPEKSALDGQFVRVAHRKFTDAWIAKFAECLKAAAKSGELQQNPVRRDLRAWFVHHIAFALMLHLHPKIPAVNYKLSREMLIEQAVRFALYGVGLTEKSIRQHYNPKALSLLAG